MRLPGFPLTLVRRACTVPVEDDFADTIVQRLIGMGADLSKKIHRVDGIGRAGSETGAFHLADSRAIAAHLEKYPAVRMVVIDPVGAYGGGSDDHKDSDLCQLLGPLTDVAAAHEVTVVMVRHLNKSAAEKASHRVTGAGAWINASRSALLFGFHPDDTSIVAIAQMKSNLAPLPESLAYRLGRPSSEELQAAMKCPQLGKLDFPARHKVCEQLFRPMWIDGIRSVNADDLVSTKKKKEESQQEKQPKTNEQGAEWIDAYLVRGKLAASSDLMFEDAKTLGFSFNAIKNAKEILKGRGYKAQKRSGVVNGPWWFGKGNQSDWVERPLSAPLPSADALKEPIVEVETTSPNCSTSSASSMPTNQ